MKRIILVMLAAAIGLGIFTVDAAAQNKKSETVTFDTTITCGNCQKKLEENIPFEKGVKDMKVDVQTKKVTVTYDPAKTDPVKIRAAIEKLGYKATPEEKPAEAPDEKNE